MLARLFAYSVAAMLLVVPSAAQTVTFSTTSYPYNLWNQLAGPNGTARGDLNADGREDFVTSDTDQFNSGCTGSFAVVLSTGDGKYASPVCYTLPSGNAALITLGDFYGNGFLDVMVANDTGLAYLYQNDGLGGLEFGNTFTLKGPPAGMVAADVNMDGLVDLVYDINTTDGSSTSLYTLLGDGAGAFLGSGPTTTFTMDKEPGWALYYGDFDGDGKTDILVEGAAQVEDEILYGNGEGSFTPGPIVGGTGPQFTAYGAFNINGDGTMDLIGTPFYGNPEGANTYYKTLNIQLANANRTLTSKTLTLKNCTTDGWPPQVADFNGDGINDIAVVEGADCKGDGPYTLNILLGKSDGTYEPEQVVYTTGDWIAEWHVMRASHSSKPDLALYQAVVQNNQISDPEEVVLVNTSIGNFPACTPPNFLSTGFDFCSPTATTGLTSPVTFSLGGADQELGRDINLWVDGEKVDENERQTYSHYDFLSATVPLSDGEHTVTAYAIGWDYTKRSATIKVNVGNATCPVPSTDGINVCSPIGGPVSYSTVTSPVLAQASGSVSGEGNIVRMEVWVDGVKEYSTFGSDTLKTSIKLAAGWHEFDYYIVSSEEEKWESTVWTYVE
jgi:FG-GAP-like repeat